MGVSSEVWAGRSSWCAGHRDRGYGASRDGHAGTSVCFEPTIHDGSSAGDDGDRVDRAVTRSSVGTVRPREYDGCYLNTSQSSEAGAFEHFKCVVCDDWGTGARVTRAAEYN